MAHGLLNSTVVYVTGGFGRTPKIKTERVGRDHDPRNMHWESITSKNYDTTTGRPVMIVGDGHVIPELFT